MISFRYQSQGVHPPLGKLAHAVKKVLAIERSMYCEVVFMTPERIRALNAERRDTDAVTDVLSFPNLEFSHGKLEGEVPDFEQDKKYGLDLGSIAVCLTRAEEQAALYGHSKKREIYYLIAHGTLHLLGYDHATEPDRAEMRDLEEKIMRAMHLERRP